MGTFVIASLTLIIFPMPTPGFIAVGIPSAFCGVELYEQGGIWADIKAGQENIQESKENCFFDLFPSRWGFTCEGELSLACNMKKSLDLHSFDILLQPMLQSICRQKHSFSMLLVMLWCIDTCIQGTPTISASSLHSQSGWVASSWKITLLILE